MNDFNSLHAVPACPPTTPQTDREAVEVSETWHAQLTRLVRGKDYAGALALLRSPVQVVEQAQEWHRMAALPSPDPDHQDEVSALGERMGFGALMHAASYGWRRSLADDGFPVGGEFTVGPCRATAEHLAALTPEPTPASPDLANAPSLGVGADT